MNTSTTPLDEVLLTTEQAAKYLQMQTNTLAVWRMMGRYNLPFIKIGRKVFYKKSEIEKWLIKRTVHPKPLKQPNI